MSQGHGSSPAAWTAVVLIIVGFAVGGLGLVAGRPAGFYLGIALAVLGCIAGKALQALGFGDRGTHRPTLTRDPETG